MSGTTFLRGENPLKADKLNAAFSERVWRRGDTMQGMLTLWQDPINPFDAATKQYVDRVIVPPQGAMGPPGPAGPMGPPGSVDAGSVTGPLYWTATGGNTSRSAQDRSADIANVLDFGAGPAQTTDSTTAFRAALATGRNVFVPRGTYLITGQLTLSISQQAQTFYGEGNSSVLLIDTRFDPSVTTGVITFTSTSQSLLQPVIRDLAIKFVQPSDLITTTTASSAAGTNTITVASTVGIVVGMSVVCQTHRDAIPTKCYFTAKNAATVTAIVGNVITLSVSIIAPGISNGDVVQFASVRSMFKTLAEGGTAGPGGTGVKYPWAIYAPVADMVLLERVMIIDAWDGIWLRGSSSFHIGTVFVGAFDVGLDIDECYNFPSIIDFSFWLWGYWPGAGPLSASRDAFSATYYDGQTICANIGRVDGLCAYNLQTWTGIVNLTPNCGGGYFHNLMLDGDNANLNVLCSSGPTQITGGYTSKGATTIGTSIFVNTVAGATTTFSHFNFSGSSPTDSGVVVQNGRLAISDSDVFNGQQGVAPYFAAHNNSSLFLRGMRLDAGGGGIPSYVVLTDTATLRMSDCAFLRNVTGLVDQTYFAVSGTANTPVSLDNNTLNGWHVNLPTGKNNWLPSAPSYANDSAAAAGGVEIGQDYRNGSARMVRVA